MSSDGIRVDVAYVGDVTVVTVSGELDVVSAPVLRHLLQASRPDSRVVVNVGGVQFIDSLAWKVLVAQQGRFHDAGGSLEIDSPSRAVQRLAGTLPFEPYVPSDAATGTAIAPVVSLCWWVQNRRRRNRRSGARTSSRSFGPSPAPGYCSAVLDNADEEVDNSAGAQL